jgi:hypothetical protein
MESIILVAEPDPITIREPEKSTKNDFLDKEAA